MKFETTPAPESGAAEHTMYAPATASSSGTTTTNDKYKKSTALENVQEPTDTSKSRRSGSFLRLKAKRACPRILLLVACLIYIFTVFMALDIGLQDISVYLKPRLENARIELRAKSNLRYREQMLYTQLDKMLDKQLRFRYMETYDDCLVRGLQEANSNFFGLGYQYPDIRDKTMGWAMENCGRLIFSPQVAKHTPQQAAMTHWASTTYKSRHVIDKTFDTVTSAWVRFVRVFSMRSSKAAEVLVQTEALSHKQPIAHPKMPFGFTLICEGSSPCKLTYPKTADDTKTISQNEIVESVLKVDELSRICAKINCLQKFMLSQALNFLALETLFLLVYVATGVYLFYVLPSMEEKHKAFLLAINNPTLGFTDEQRYVAGSLTLQLTVLVVHMVLGHTKQVSDKLNLVTGILIVGLGVSMLISFFFPVFSNQLETVSGANKALKELYAILSNQEEGPEPAAPAEVVKKRRKYLTVEGLQESVSRPLRKPSSYRQEPISLGTTVQEDVKAKVEAMREEQNYHAYFESDGDSEFEGEPFVDLAGGITPTTEEVEGEPDAIVVNA